MTRPTDAGQRLAIATRDLFVRRRFGVRRRAAPFVQRSEPWTHGSKLMPDLREHALAFGVQTMADVDLLALLLGTGTAGESVALSAAALLDGSGGLEGIARLGPHGLSRKGIGPAKATRIAAAVELGRRAHLQLLTEERAVFDCFEQVVRWARPRLATLEHEEVWLLSLDGKYGLKSARRIAQGGLHGCALLTRDVLSPALRDGASAIVLIHNHPSGDPTPSAEDIAMTRAVQGAGELVGVPLIDHVVVARGGACSLTRAFDQALEPGPTPRPLSDNLPK